MERIPAGTPVQMKRFHLIIRAVPLLKTIILPLELMASKRACLNVAGKLPENSRR